MALVYSAAEICQWMKTFFLVRFEPPAAGTEPIVNFLFSFTPEIVMERCPNLGLVVDLTNTNRYYNGQVSSSSFL